MISIESGMGGAGDQTLVLARFSQQGVSVHTSGEMDRLISDDAKDEDIQTPECR